MENQTHSVVFKLWMLYFQPMSFFKLCRDHNSSIMSLYHVAALISLPVHRYSVVTFYIFWSCGTVWLNTFIWKQSCAQPGARRSEGSPICHYLSRTVSLKPSLLFSNCGCYMFSKDLITNFVSWINLYAITAAAENTLI